jgi:hypothetical protein
MPRLIPCPSCQSHVFAGDRTCPHCGASLRSSGTGKAAVLVSLTLTGCPTNIEPVYGEADTVDSVDTGETADMDTDTETGTGTDSETDTDVGTDTDDGETDTVGEPEYGVPDTGTDTSTDDTDTSTDTGGEPLYGVADSGD